MKDGKMQNDLGCPLRESRNSCGVGLISQLIQIQHYRLQNDKRIDWYHDSTYLTRDYNVSDFKAAAPKHQAPCSLHNMLQRTQQDHQTAIRSVLAVSYTWATSKFEDHPSEDFYVFETAQPGWKKSKVRSSIVSRVLRYVSSYHLPGFWIDGDCVEQNEPSEKQIAMQSMDLIYRWGDHSVAFLTSPVRTAKEVRLLAQLMSDKWIWQPDSIGRIKLKKYVRLWNAAAMIDLLEHILSDLWWTRAWTYHEEYCASTKMYLLLPCYAQIPSDSKYRFGKVRHELRIPTVDFREQVTRFCLAHQQKVGERWHEGSIRCKHLLKIARRYQTIETQLETTTADYTRQALSWRIIRDLANRQMSHAWDILAIIANCCGYSVRLDADRLRRAGYNLSAAVLALVLLNGEILHNDVRVTWSGDANILDVLASLAFRGFTSVVDVKEFTFLKRCRMVNVSLRHDGLLTEGCIWILHERIRVPVVPTVCDTKIQMKDRSLSVPEIKQLQLVCRKIRYKHPTLAAKIRHFLQQVEAEEGDGRLRSLLLMARHLIRSVQSGKLLSVASLIGQGVCQGLFVADDTADYCFTAWQPRSISDALSADHYLEKIISLQVDLVSGPGHLRCIKTGRWMNGLCFFDTPEQEAVLLPWPAPLMTL